MKKTQNNLIMKVQVLISSINKTIQEFNKNTLDYNDIVIINQQPNRLSNESNTKIYNNVRWIDIDQKGLSRSRNYAIEEAEANQFFQLVDYLYERVFLSY